MKTVTELKRELTESLKSPNLGEITDCVERLSRAIAIEELTMRGLIDKPWKPGDPVHKPHYGSPVWPPQEGEEGR